MVLSTLIQKDSVLVGSDGSVFSRKMISQSLTHYDPHLKNVDGNSLSWVFHYLLRSFGNFCSGNT